MRIAELFKTVILELMQSMCALDEKLMSKACKTIQMFQKNLYFCINTPIS